jgi:hypothetical protein
MMVALAVADAAAQLQELGEGYTYKTPGSGKRKANWNVKDMLKDEEFLKELSPGGLGQ